MADTLFRFYVYT